MLSALGLLSMSVFNYMVGNGFSAVLIYPPNTPIYSIHPENHYFSFHINWSLFAFHCISAFRFDVFNDIKGIAAFNPIYLLFALAFFLAYLRTGPENEHEAQRKSRWLLGYAGILIITTFVCGLMSWKITAQAMAQSQQLPPLFFFWNTLTLLPDRFLLMHLSLTSGLVLAKCIYDKEKLTIKNMADDIARAFFPMLIYCIVITAVNYFISSFSLIIPNPLSSTFTGPGTYLDSAIILSMIYFLFSISLLFVPFYIVFEHMNFKDAFTAGLRTIKFHFRHIVGMIVIIKLLFFGPFLLLELIHYKGHMFGPFITPWLLSCVMILWDIFVLVFFMNVFRDFAGHSQE